jgi:hypothetical protein
MASVPSMSALAPFSALTVAVVVATWNALADVSHGLT